MGRHRSRSRSRDRGDDGSPSRKHKHKHKSHHKHSGSSRAESDKRDRRRDRDGDPRRKKKKKEQTPEEICGYSNENNPFGDSTLTSKFVWDKKIKQKGADKYDRMSERERKRVVEERVSEIKNRREQTEREKVAMEEARWQIERERENALFGSTAQREEEFAMEQARKRSEIRIKEGRAKPIDVLAKALEGDAVLDVRIPEPWTVFKGLEEGELTDLLSDIDAHASGTSGESAAFWRDVRELCVDEMRSLRQARELESMSNTAAAARQAVIGEAESMLLGKTQHELVRLRVDVEEQLASGAVDTEFFEAIKSRLSVAQARERLREARKLMMKKRLEELEADPSALEAYTKEDEGNFAGQEEGAETVAGGMSSDGNIAQSNAIPDDSGNDFNGALLSAQLKSDSKDNKDDPWASGDEDMGGGDEIEIAANKSYAWASKYRPRKPRYHNRVNTGYDWNNYNKTHYDIANPPPKSVQGYKFNIFYPDLIDPSKPPTFQIEPDADIDTCILRFKAGPPYEDLAFRIVKNEWDRSHRHGFKCSFDRGILHLWFKFKKFRYRK